MQSLDFSDLARKTVQVKLGPKEYVIQEASADDAIAWRNATMKAARWSSDGKVTGVDGLADTEALLVSRCLKECLPTGPGDCSLGFVRGLPARILKKLYETAVDISGLREDGTDPRAQQFADLLARPDSPVGYEAMRDYVRGVVGGPDGDRFPNLKDFLEAEGRGPKS